MGQARVTRFGLGTAAALLGAVAVASPRPAGAAQSRFASYDTEADCVGAKTFPAGVCHTAFANARSEYESKTPSFPTAAQCGRRFPDCMAWPPGAEGRAAAYRPRWDGVDIVDTPTEKTATPSPGATGRTIRFAARPLESEPRPLEIRGVAAPRGPAVATPPKPGLPVARAGAEREERPSAPPPPGSGFKLENGILTYPAPARFQPKNLPKPPPD